ncbi:MAG: EamA family transporter [Gammaproteobacteria bacterium]
MFEPWIYLTVLAAFLLNIRTLVQKKLTGQLSPVGATSTRFIYGIPVVLTYVWLLYTYGGFEVPHMQAIFALWAAAGGLAQLVGTVLLLKVLQQTNFFVGTAFARTSSIQTAIVGFVLLAEAISFLAGVGIVIGVAGSMLLAWNQPQWGWEHLKRVLSSRSAILGLTSGLLFGFGAVCYRGASLSLDSHIWMNAAWTLMVVVVWQTVMVCGYMLYKESGEMSEVLARWRPGCIVGLTGIVSSIGWFTAMTYQKAAYVMALGQIEAIFTYLTSVLVFRETVLRRQWLGSGLISIGIVVLIVAT